MYPAPQCIKYLHLQIGCSEKAANLPRVARESEPSVLEGQGISLLTRRGEGLSPSQPHNFTSLLHAAPCEFLWGSLQCSCGCWSSPLLQPLKVRGPSFLGRGHGHGFFMLPSTCIIPKIFCPFLPFHRICGGERTNRRMEI